MKTQIIQLESHDDIISARDKMGWGQTSRILLIWPESGQVLNRRLDLVLLQRHTASLGAQLALVTHDLNVRFYTRELAIPVFENLRQAQNSSWRVKHRRSARRRSSLHRSEESKIDLISLGEQAHPQTPAWMSKPVARLTFFTIGVLAFLSIAAILLPTAIVTLDPKTKSQVITLQINANPEIEVINLSGTIPARPIRVTVEGRSSLPTTGTIKVPDKYASGRITFTNLSNQSISIPAGTVVRTLGSESVRFITTKSGEVPAVPGETISMPAQSIRPGKVGNLPSGSLVAIEGTLGLSLAATNPLPTSGGIDRIAPAPTEDDRQQLHEQLAQDLQLSAINELQDQLSQDDLVFTSSITLTRIVEETYTPAEDLPSDQLKLNLRLEFEALTVAGDDIHTLVTNVLDANIPEGFIAIPETLNISFIDEPLIGYDANARWRVYASRNIQAQFPETRAVNLTLGLPPSQAKQRLSSSLPLDRSPELAISPVWWPRMPLLPFRVTIVSE